MTDRELLELAANAAALPGIWIEGFGYRVDCEEPYFWNPLTDDAHALRLSVKLKMSMVLDSSGFKGPTTWVRATGLRTEKTQYHEGDPYAATRRAIVRSAAEIGRAME